MKPARKNILIFLIFVFALSIKAQSVTSVKVVKAAKNWVNNFGFLLVPQTKEETKFIPGAPVPISNGERTETIAYVVPLWPKGYVIFSANKNLKPVLGYSTLSNFDFNDSPYNFTLMLVRKDMKIRLSAIRNGKFKGNVIESNKNKWESLIKGIKPDERTAGIVGPFVVSDWGQGFVNGEPLYNYYTPHNYPAGCVATALAQVMNFYKWPPRGTGSHGYTDGNEGYQYADFGNTNYDWVNTLDTYTDVWITDAQRKAVATLVYHSAVSVNMDFEADGSTASVSDVPYALHNYFRFAGHYKSSNTSGFWTALKNNMLDYRPAIIAISGGGNAHAAVVCGYSDFNNYYFLNPGWYGNYNGWYDISGSWEMSGYTYVNGAAKGIVPSPMIVKDERVDRLRFKLTWRVSPNQRAQYYELDWSKSYGGPWYVVNSNIPDTFYTVTASNFGTYYYRVRTRRDNIWWDYSKPYKVSLENNIQLIFNVDMTERPLKPGESLGVRGNIPPLMGSSNTGNFTDENGDGIYSASVFFDMNDAGKTLLYRFCVESDSGADIEQETREYLITEDNVQTLPVVKFNGLSLVSNTFTTPKTFKLFRNYPNPFGKGSASKSKFTNIKFSLPEKGNLLISVFDITGRQIIPLVKKTFPAGTFNLKWNGKDKYGNPLSSGIYFLRAKYKQNVFVNKMIFLK